MAPDDHTVPPAKSPLDDPSVELSARRTGMSFQRTRMSADRTLMAVIRTSLSLISFGFTIYQFFERMAETKVITSADHQSRRFGLSLVLLGLVMLSGRNRVSLGLHGRPAIPAADARRRRADPR